MRTPPSFIPSFSEKYTFFATDVEIRGHFDSISMKTFLGRCVGLKRFKFTQLGPNVWDHQLLLLPSAVSEGLEGHKRTLQELDFESNVGTIPPDIGRDSMYEEPLKNREEFRDLNLYQWGYPWKSEPEKEEVHGDGPGSDEVATSEGEAYLYWLWGLEGDA